MLPAMRASCRGQIQAQSPEPETENPKPFSLHAGIIGLPEGRSYPGGWLESTASECEGLGRHRSISHRHLGLMHTYQLHCFCKLWVRPSPLKPRSFVKLPWRGHNMAILQSIPPIEAGVGSSGRHEAQ